MVYKGESMPLEWPFKIIPHVNINEYAYAARMQWVSVRTKYWLKQLENM